MSIYIKNKEVTQIFCNNKPIMVLYRGATVIWEAINSCFGRGYWIDTKGWVNKDGWRNIN